MFCKILPNVIKEAKRMYYNKKNIKPLGVSLRSYVENNINSSCTRANDRQ